MNHKYKNSSKLSVASIIGLFLIIAAAFSAVFFIPMLIGLLKGEVSSPASLAGHKNSSAKVIETHSGLSAVDLEEELLTQGRGSADIKLIINAIIAGYNDAKSQQITSHTECKKIEQELAREGCNRYVTEQKHIPVHVRQGDFDQGKKSEQCIAEVRDYYEALITDLIEQEKDVTEITKTKKDKQAELEECDRYDGTKPAFIRNKVLIHLNLLIEKIEQNGAASDQDLIPVLKDVNDWVVFENQIEENEFKKNIQDFIQLVDAEANASSLLACDHMKKKADALLNIQKGMELVINYAQKNKWQDKFWDYRKLSRKALLWHRIVLIDKAKTIACAINDSAR